jgi:carbamate kinase
LGNNNVALQAYNGQYVCAEGGGGREVVANRNAVNAWETFKLLNLGNNNVALQAYNGQYVCAEGGGGREVVANRNAVNAWETFRSSS